MIVECGWLPASRWTTGMQCQECACVYEWFCQEKTCRWRWTQKKKQHQILETSFSPEPRMYISPRVSFSNAVVFCNRTLLFKNRTNILACFLIYLYQIFSRLDNCRYPEILSVYCFMSKNHDWEQKEWRYIWNVQTTVRTWHLLNLSDSGYFGSGCPGHFTGQLAKTCRNDSGDFGHFSLFVILAT